MSLLAKLQQLKINYSTTDRISVNNKQLRELFGKDYQKKLIVINRRKYCFVFEEEKNLYYVIIDKTHEPVYFIEYNSNDLLPYSKLGDVFILTLLRIKRKHEKNHFIPYSNEQLQRIENVLNHPSLRLRSLFMKDKK